MQEERGKSAEDQQLEQYSQNQSQSSPRNTSPSVPDRRDSFRSDDSAASDDDLTSFGLINDSDRE